MKATAHSTLVEIDMIKAQWHIKWQGCKGGREGKGERRKRERGRGKEKEGGREREGERGRERGGGAGGRDRIT